MYFALMGKLNARRKGLMEQDEKGFTLIELLVVVIIIGILAAIAIPVYLGVQNNAKDSGVQNDVSNLKTAIVSIQTQNSGTLPDTATLGTKASIDGFPATGGTAGTQSWSNAGTTWSDSETSLKYVKLTATTFCVSGASSTGKFFQANQTDGVKSATAACA